MLKKCLLLLLLLFTTSVSVHAQTVTTHPRLWIRGEDLPRLQSWASADNPIFSEGVALRAAEGVAAMDAGIIPAQDTGSVSYEEYPTESYAALFAFMSLIDPDENAREDYAQRARTLLMYVMDQAVLGVTDEPFRAYDFAIADRSRWYGVNFALTVDWIYPYLSAEDKSTIRTVFLRWCDENMNAATTNYNHPEPVGVVNDPILVSDQTAVRWAGNNYYAAHMRNMGMMALSFDPADDPDGELASYLTNATGAWLYVIDHLLRTDAAGGLGTEGFEYSPQSLGYTAEFLLALQTAGANDTALYGQQVSFDANPFWNDSIIAYMNSLSPRQALNPDYGEMVYLPAWYGSAQNYWMPDYIEVFGSLGIYAQIRGDEASLAALRWLQTYSAPGSAEGLIDRVQSSDSTHKSILYFLLFDPAVNDYPDPRQSAPTAWYASGVRRLLARTDWSENASFFSYSLTWNTVDHQSGNGNAIEFYRMGEWLTKVRTGYDFDYHTSDNLNTLTVSNTLPDRDDFRLMIGQRGSQWLYSAGEPPAPLYSINDTFIYAYGDSTNLYNSEYEGLSAVQHVSRSVVWLKPDIIVVYDRAATDAENPFIRFWLNFPEDATVDGNLTTMTTESGQSLYVQTLLPTDAQISVSPLVDEVSAPPANLEPMRYRLMVAADGVSETRFLNVLQGADAGTTPLPTTQVDSIEGTFQGVTVDTTTVMFPINVDEAFATFSYVSTVSQQIITGLTPNASYDVTFTPDANGTLITVSAGSQFTTDSGGVLLVTAP